MHCFLEFTYLPGSASWLCISLVALLNLLGQSEFLSSQRFCILLSFTVYLKMLSVAFFILLCVWLACLWRWYAMRGWTNILDIWNYKVFEVWKQENYFFLMMYLFYFVWEYFSFRNAGLVALWWSIPVKMYVYMYLALLPERAVLFLSCWSWNMREVVASFSVANSAGGILMFLYWCLVLASEKVRAVLYFGLGNPMSLNRHI